MNIKLNSRTKPIYRKTSNITTPMTTRVVMEGKTCATNSKVTLKNHIASNNSATGQ